MDSHFVRKIMVDSRFRKSGVPGSFTFELNRAITLPSKCAGFITDIELVHSWWTVDTHNEYLFFYESFVTDGETDIYFSRYHRVQITKQTYSAADLATELLAKINAPLVNGQRSITTTYAANTGRLTFGVAAVPPVLSGAGGPWTKTDLLGGTVTADMTLQSGYTYEDSSDGRTFEFTSFNGGPTGTARIFMTETDGSYSYCYEWDNDNSRFKPIGSTDYWTPPVVDGNQSGS